MKKLSFFLFTLAILGGACKKTTDVAAPLVSLKPKVATSDTVAAAALPTAVFKITNANGPATIWEGLNLAIENTSENAVSYSWDFGDGATKSTDKIPTEVALFPCATTVTIRLTVKNRTGQSATYSTPYTILCSRGMGFGSHKDKNPG